MSSKRVRVKVTKGISAWLGKTGVLLDIIGNEVVVELEGKDDAGHGVYPVRMYRDLVDILDDVPLLGPVSHDET